MHRFKRTLVWLLVAALVLTGLPAQLAKQASAASTPTAATYFIPDLKALKDTALLDHTDVNNNITRTNVYQTSNGNLTITGTYAYVSSNSMSVKVEQLSAASDGTWLTDATHVTTGTVTAVSGSTNRFTTGSLPLFSGFNKITFTGLQGSVSRSDIFYVLYDNVPYIKSLKVVGGSSGSVNLNEGTQVVMDSANVTLQGIVQNATKVTLSLNGGTAMMTSLLDDGTFFTPAITLSPGINTVKLVIINGTDSITITRTIYYYDKDRPFTKLDFNDGSTDYSLLNNNVPIVTKSTMGTTNLNVELLVPYDSIPFLDNATYSLNGSAYDVVDNIPGQTTETIIAGADGVTATYRLVSFQIPYAVDSAVIDQPANVTVKYGSSFSFTAIQTGKFQYRPNETVIKEMYFLSGLKSTDTTIANASKVPLNGAEVLTPDFYILVKTDSAPSKPLLATYVPGATAVTLTDASSQFSGLATDGTEQVYLVSAFASGQQTVKFQYESSTAYYNANISYASQSYIYISNLYDGQTYTFDSRSDHTLTINGQYIGFDFGSPIDTTGIQMFVNGTVLKDTNQAEIKPVITAIAGSPKNYSFTATLGITAAGPLIYGENRIMFTGITTDASGHIQQISKEIRINIIDQNVSKIDKFYPVMITTPRESITDTVINASTYPDEKLAKIFTVSPEFVFGDDKYTTNEEKYDIVASGSGAKYLNLYNGSDLMGHIDLSDSSRTQTAGIFSYGGTSYTYRIAGNSDNFIFRLEDLSFAEPGSMVFNLELINETGARSTQRLEVVREVKDFLLLAPQPTVGDQIIVNKNFVRFDIEAEGATSVIIDKFTATKRSDYDDRFIYDYIGLKANKNNAIKIQVVRKGTTTTHTVNVYYSDTVQVDSQYMMAMSNKMSVFNKSVELAFPKNTVLHTPVSASGTIDKIYPNTQLLFGIADERGIVERRNDYGNTIGDQDSRSNKGQYSIYLPEYLISKFQSTANTGNFMQVSNTYWISGGLGELGDKGTTGYQPSINGVAPYAINPYATVASDSTLRFTEIPTNRRILPSNRGELTLTFDTNIVDDAGTTITVFHYGESGKWVNIGGEVNMKSHTITVPFDEFGYYKVMKLRRGFSDITNHTWARNILNALFSKGIMNATQPPTVFGADDQTTRGEFATLIVKGLNLPINSDNTQTFYDVLPGVSTVTWSYDYIETAARAGIINGITEGVFNPEGKITREEAAVMIARALKLKMPTNDSKLEAQLSKLFLDSSSIQYYSRPAISVVSKAKIMSGSPVTVGGKTQYNFNPKSKMTRAEAGKIAVALLLKSTSIFPSNLS
ncbi:S-layer homology domain-containing protein [Cohnella sp. AR92]|uniref:S-layer homology domain-containing protein n=1 Tax=Cohnella sp. AR92 TaxID=648716 RepID=UPI0013156D55|nr:S-layer homology domain-containing protein [Cohnella sp. AR92]